MLRNSFSFFLHTTAVSVMSYGYLHLPDIGNLANMRGGRFQFLTIQGLVIASIAMALSVGCDILPSSRILKNVKRVFLMIALPPAILISVVYWTLFLTMPQMILFSDSNASEASSSSVAPEPVQLPLHIDMALHAAPGCFLFIDFYFLEKKYSKNVSRYGSLALAAILGTGYACWVEHCASYNGFFPYPFLTINPFNIRIAIYAGGTAFAAIAFMLINHLHP